ncbi:hypothetical protein FALBO_3056 [Fusarium albosuccineum]|uniref:DUF6536 domain-containing protein n=1 Tax=Fusarium albosuccineum TaxID=1237068 RepID=A0A8H4PL94_9HYPO|nr:hypothetical protein FALBO_3056 [Fusarium albosuccineum]
MRPPFGHSGPLFRQRYDETTGLDIFEDLADLTELLDRDTSRTEEPAPGARIVSRHNASTTNKTGKELTGWRAGASYFAMAALLSLLLNIILAIWVPTLESFHHGIGVLWTGSCRTVSLYNKLIHFGISAITTLLLSGSNYCMQCLTAPTRQNLQKAHAKGIWLDIGVQSIRNLNNIMGYKAILWFLIALSSVPIHLLQASYCYMYNSAFFMSLDSNSYQVYVVSRDFWNSTDTIPVYRTPPIYLRPWLQEPQQLPHKATEHLNAIKNTQTRPGLAEKNHFGDFERLSNDQCIDAYAKSVVNGRRTVIITATNETEKGPFALGYEYKAEDHVNNSVGVYRPYEWMCFGMSSANDPPLCYEAIHNLTKAPEEWAPWNFTAEYCHSKVVKENCALNASQPIIIVIVICNLFKVVIMAMMVLWVKGHPIMTLGDAIRSFLDEPDPTTEGLCLLSKDAVKYQPIPSWPREASSDEQDPIMARRKRYRWSDAVSTRRWTLTLGLLGASIMVVVIFLGLGIDSMKDNNSVAPFSVGFGDVDAAAVITYWAVSNYKNREDRILAAVIVANLPQMIFSVITFSLNSLITIVYAAREWDSFSRQRKTLRVSEPKGGQRSTYFLQLPYRISLPFSIATGVISWLLSNSIFPIIISQYSSSGELMEDVQSTTCGFSPWPMVVAIAVGVVLVGGVCSFFFLNFVTIMPMVGTCSAAISAACHHDGGRDEVSLQPVKWGAVFIEDAGEGQDLVGHCCLTSSLVKRPKPGRLYAGKDTYKRE